MVQLLVSQNNSSVFKTVKMDHVFNLSRLAMIAWSASYWNRPNVRNKLHKLIDKRDFQTMPSSKELKNIIDAAQKEIKSINLPMVLYDRLIQTILSLGCRIVSWHYRKIFPCQYIKAYHWTIFGTISEAKIIKNDYVEQLYTSNLKEEILIDIYHMACTSVLKDFIIINAKKILELCKKNENQGDKVRFILSSILTLASPEHLELTAEEQSKLIQKYFIGFKNSKESYMFLLSVEKGYFGAAQYYWQQLNSSDKEKNVITAAFKCCEKLRFESFLFVNNHFDILVFIFMQLSDEELNEFLSVEQFPGENKINWVLKRLVRSCGWEDIFFTLFDQFKERIEKCADTYRGILWTIFGALHSRRKFDLDSKNTVYNEMFLRVWREINKFDSADSPFIPFEKITWFIPLIFDDFRILNIFLEKYSNCREDFLLQCKKTVYEELIKKNRFDLLEKFMETVLNSEDERKWFKNQHFSIEDLISKKKFEVADNLLNWLSDSKEEQKKIKHRVDFLSLCAKYFTNNNLNLAGKILSWAFSNDQEKAEYISSFESTSELDFLHLFWSENDDFPSNLSKFLNWFFNSERKDVRYKIGKLFTESAVRNFFTQLNNKLRKDRAMTCMELQKLLKQINELLEFCLPYKNLQKLKAEIVKNSNKWLLYLAEDRCWGRLDFFLNWSLGYKTEEFDREEIILHHKKKKEVVKTFLLSTDNVEFFKIILSSTRYKNFKPYLYLWIQWTGKINRIENCIAELDASLLNKSSFVSNSIKNIKSDLKNLKKGVNPCEGPSMSHVCVN